MSIRSLGGAQGGSRGVIIDLQQPHLIDYNEDVLSTGVLIYNIKVREITLH